MRLDARRLWTALSVGLLVSATVTARVREAAPTPLQLRAAAFQPDLVIEGVLPGGPNYSAYRVGYHVAGLIVHALVAVPNTPRPKAGYPVLIAHHGTHPNPPRYGFTADGIDSRPGDYYRPVPALYAAAGFLVIMPDYRGHNSSEGAEYTGGLLSPAYYAEDVVALLAGLDRLPEADGRNVFLWGHSLGGEVGLRVLLAIPRIRAASLWDTVAGDPWERALLHSRPMGSGTALAALEAELAAQPIPYEGDAGDPLRFLDALETPVMLHHAQFDPEVAVEASLRLAGALARHHKPYELHTYASHDHFFNSPERELAVQRDVDFFRAHMALTDTAN
jgi:dienelactone hydrolase